MSDTLHSSFRQHLASPIGRVVLPSDPSVTIARVEHCLTLYLDDPAHWAREGAAVLLDSFLAVVPPDHIGYLSTSHVDRWLAVDRSLQQRLREMLSLPWAESTPRHLFQFEIADDVYCPSCGFRYAEVDPERSECAAVIEITLPQEFDAGYLLPIARAALSAGPLYSGVGGLGVRMNQAYLADAFDVAWAFSQRFRGVDIQFPERTAWVAAQGLPGTGWLTVLGGSLAAHHGFDLTRAKEHRWTLPTITTEMSGANLMVVAGDAPALGDTNRFDELDAYREVAHITRKLQLQDPPELLGRFRDEGDSEHWFKRLLATEG